MIIDVWSSIAASGKLPQARELNKRVCQYHNDQELVLRAYGIVPVNGQLDKIIAVVEFESLATMEQYYTEFWESGWPKFKDEWDDAATVEGSFERYQYRTQE